LQSPDRISRLHDKYFPQPVGEGSFEGQQFYAESMLEGIAGDTLKISYKKREVIINETFYFWKKIQKSLEARFNFDKYIFSNMIEKPLKYVFFLTGNIEILKDTLEIILKYLKSRLMHREFILSLVHGDFSLKNIIFYEKDLTLSGIIDWDRACIYSFPLFDVFHFFVRIQEMSYYESSIHTIIKMLEKYKNLNNFNNVLDTYCKEFFIEKDTILSIVIMYWIHLLSGFESIKFLNKHFVKKSFDDPLELLVKIIL
jgi:aminoglycoside phosphotransferase (APT) family kinase protein